jgi:phage-related protein
MIVPSLAKGFSSTLDANTLNVNFFPVQRPVIYAESWSRNGWAVEKETNVDFVEFTLSQPWDDSTVNLPTQIGVYVVCMYTWGSRETILPMFMDNFDLQFCDIEVLLLRLIIMTDLCL